MHLFIKLKVPKVYSELKLRKRHISYFLTLGTLAHFRHFELWLLAIADCVDYNGIGGTGNADTLANYQDNLFSNLSPFTIDNIAIYYLRELNDVLRDWLATRHYTIMQAHLVASLLVGA